MNKEVITTKVQFGLIACVLVVPFAILAGAWHGIPFWWRLIDCSFGVVGFAILYPCYRNIKTLTAQQPTTNFKTLIYANKIF